MPVGSVKFFNEEKGFGFISPEGGGNDVFVHISQLRASEIDKIEKDDRVSYSLGEKNGKIFADIIKLLPRTVRSAAATESPLLAQARARAQAQGNHPETIAAWNRVRNYISDGQSKIIASEVSYGNGSGSRQPPFSGEWGKLTAWCKLVGFRLYWHDPKSGFGQGGAWTWHWSLMIDACPPADDRLQKKLIEEYGRPPGF